MGSQELKHVWHELSRPIVKAPIERIFFATTPPSLEELFEDCDKDADSKRKVQVKHLVRRTGSDSK